MKLKFTDISNAVIEKVCQLPWHAESDEDIDGILSIINKETLDIKHRKEKAIGGKRWAVVRREMSFFYGIVAMFDEKIPDKRFRYARVVSMFKDIKSGEVLKIVPFVRLAMGYGVVRLSDTEIEHLIKFNKI